MVVCVCREPGRASWKRSPGTGLCRTDRFKYMGADDWSRGCALRREGRNGANGGGSESRQLEWEWQGYRVMQLQKVPCSDVPWSHAVWHGAPWGTATLGLRDETTEGREGEAKGEESWGTGLEG